MPHCATRPGLRFVTSSFPVLFCGCQRSHTNTHIRGHVCTPTPSILLGMRTSALNFVFGTRLSSSRWPATLPFLYPFFTRHSLTGLSFFITKKKNLEEHLSLVFFLLGNKSKLNGKTQVFFLLFFFFKFKAQCLSIFQSVCLSVSTPRFSV